MDTNALSEPLRPQPDAELMRWLQAHENAAAIPSPVWHELLHGCFRLPRSRRREAIETYLMETLAPSFAIVPYDAAAARWHAHERARLTSVRRTPPYVDGQIAAIAAINGLILLTANLKDFEAFEGLQVTSWRSSETRITEGSGC